MGQLTEWKQNFTDVSSAIKNKMHELGVRGCLKNTVAYATEGALSLAALAAGIEFYEGAIGAIGALTSMSGGVLTTADGIQVFVGQVAAETLTKTSAIAGSALAFLKKDKIEILIKRIIHNVNLDKDILLINMDKTRLTSYKCKQKALENLEVSG